MNEPATNNKTLGLQNNLAHKRKKKMLNGDNKLISRNCFICGNNKREKILVKVPYIFPSYSKFDSYEHTLVRCLECGNNYINPTVSDKLLSNYYSSQASYEMNDDDTRILDSYELKSLQQEVFITDNIEVHNMTILDFGCATAYAMNRFKNSNNKHIGYDTSKKCSIIAKDKYNIDVYTNFTDIAKFSYNFSYAITCP